MKKYLVFMLLAIFSICILGCAKKEAGMEELQQSLSMETLSTTTATVQPVKVSEPVSAPAEKLDLPPVGNFQPTATEIQTALKNSGFYNGEIDGKIGPVTKKSIVDFQKSKGLQADGKVGPKTWEALSVYLNLPAQTGAKR
ncbi:MAG: peptidoglycan-binding domain-containing protein [Candidatus Omnitrophica bacterium]|nr:peptidoglycan-binding domain-containing protein [Candidatus Omnitrophota bacterium]